MCHNPKSTMILDIVPGIHNSACFTSDSFPYSDVFGLQISGSSLSWLPKLVEVVC